MDSCQHIYIPWEGGSNDGAEGLPGAEPALLCWQLTMKGGAAERHAAPMVRQRQAALAGAEAGLFREEVGSAEEVEQ